MKGRCVTLDKSVPRSPCLQHRSLDRLCAADLQATAMTFGD